MASDSPIYHVTSQPPNRPETPQERIRPRGMTAEDVRILQECSRESFYYRSLPFMIVSASVTYLAVKKGYLSAHPKWGSSLKQIGAAFVGWFLGKISYRSVCEEKFLHIKNSNIGEILRQKRGYKLETFQSETPPKVDDDFQFSSDSAVDMTLETDYSSDTLKIDSDKVIQYSSFDDSDSKTANEQQSQRPLVTYDELRRKNREEYDRKTRGSSTSDYSSTRQSWGSYNTQPRREIKSDVDSSSMKNVYGDSWETAK